MADPDPYEKFIGQSLGGCVIESVILRGSKRTSFLANLQGHRVFVHALSGARDKVRRGKLSEQARVLVELRHPHIMPLLRIFKSGRSLCLVESCAQGGSLTELLAQRTTLEEDQLIAIGRGAALGLAAAAKKGVVHGGLRPAALRFSARGTIKLTEFGLFHQGSDNRSGYPRYRAPELWKLGVPPGHHSDLYALGCTLYECAVGVPPFAGSAGDRLGQLHQRVPPPDPRTERPDLSDGLSHCLLRLLAKDPPDRYATGLELAAELEDLAEDSGVWHTGSDHSLPALEETAGVPDVGGS